MEKGIEKYNFNNKTITEISSIIKQICKNKDYVDDSSVSYFFYNRKLIFHLKF